MSSASNHKSKKAKQRMPMVFYLTIFIFAVSCITAIVIFAIYLFLFNRGYFQEITLPWFVLILLIGSIAISTSLVRGFGNRIIFSNLRQIIDASKAVAVGDFSQRLEAPREKEIAEICESFNEMVNKLGSNELLARDFISNVSHQFKTPIASIHGYAQLLESDDLTDEERLDYIMIIEEKSINLSKLINDILQLSRLEYSNVNISKEVYSLDEQIRKCILFNENKLTEKSLEVELDLENTKYCGSKELLGEVWNNLLENAIKFSHNNGVIRVKLESGFDNVKVIFEDNGIGMSLETQMHIYDRFYRGKEAQEHQGSGLGMPMVKNIVTKHGGNIELFSEIEKGSKFIVTLPNE